MMHRSEGATALLGMSEFVVGAQIEVGRGRRRLRVRDLLMADRPVFLVWAKRIWRCPDPRLHSHEETLGHPGSQG